MIDSLRKLFDASVVLHDIHKRKYHIAQDAGGWSSVDSTAPDGSVISHVKARINDRWIISIWSRRRLHADAGTLLRWAAEKLGAHLPARPVDEPTRLGFSGRDLSDSAEIS
jgi:hypothetical protein